MKYVVRLLPFKNVNQRGFTIVEIVMACVIFPIFVVGVSSSFNSLRRAYTTSRQLNEIYAVLSACPEVDRALEYSSLTSSTNCYPNNTFAVEHGLSGTTTYSPTLTVTDTSSLASSDPLKSVPDSKVIDIKVNTPTLDSTATNFELRMLITRNGIGQL